jgi:hypothetical protein
MPTKGGVKIGDNTDKKVNGDVKLVNILMILKVINVQLVEIQDQVLKYKKNKKRNNRISKKINV